MSDSSNKQSAQGALRVGISGWKYEPWRELFYPKGLAQKNELAYASRALPTIEINSTFYRLQRPTIFANWYAQTPADFVFSVKAPKRITHELRLRETDTALANFFASGILALKEKFGPILWQLPPNFRFDAPLLEDFLSRLPHDTRSASQLATQHDPAFEYVSTTTDELRAVRHALEVRNASFVDAAFIDLLRRHRVALVVADTGERWPEYEDLCADFVYVRLHGTSELYTSGYTDEAFDHWAERIRHWRVGSQSKEAKLMSTAAAPAAPARDVFCYFDNTYKENAPFNAKQLLAKLGVERPDVQLDK